MNKWLLLFMLLPAFCFASDPPTRSLSESEMTAELTKEPIIYERIYDDLPKEMTELQFGESVKKYEGKLFEDTGKVVSVKPHQTDKDLALVAFDTDVFDADQNKKFFPDVTVAYPKKDAIYLSKGDIKTIRGTIFKIVNIGGAHIIISNATLTDK